MKMPFLNKLIASILLTFATWPPLAMLHAAPNDPAAADYAGHKGRTIYVSKKGDNSDGSSWQKAFHKIQDALKAIPDNKGGHTIVIRPDTYVEANLAADHPGRKAPTISWSETSTASSAPGPPAGSYSIRVARAWRPVPSMAIRPSRSSSPICPNRG